jgi:hypothetical protein
MIVLWQKHQQAPGKADLGRQACALGANRVLDDLHHQRLSLKYLFFNRHLRLAFSGEHGGLAAILALPHIGHMQERRALQTDVDEGRLHARQHARNFPRYTLPTKPRSSVRSRCNSCTAPCSTTATRVSWGDQLIRMSCCMRG